MISCLSEDNHYKFMGTLFKLVVETKNADFLKSIWVVSELKLSDIIGKKDPEQFVKDFVSLYFFYMKLFNNIMPIISELGVPKRRQRTRVHF